MFEESVRVPLLIRQPGQRACQRVGGPVGQVDLMPTLLDLMDQPVPGHLQGESLGPLIRGSGTRASDRDVFIEWEGPLPMDHLPEAMKGVVSEEEAAASFTDPVRCIVSPDGWKFTCSRLGEHELYNLDQDPIEARNLARDPRYRSVMRDLGRRIRHWQVETGDTLDLGPATESLH